MRSLKARVKRIEQQSNRRFSEVTDEEFQKIIDRQPPEKWEEIFQFGRRVEVIMGNWDLLEELFPEGDALCRPPDELLQLIREFRWEETGVFLDEAEK